MDAQLVGWYVQRRIAKDIGLGVYLEAIRTGQIGQNPLGLGFLLDEPVDGGSPSR
jgi:hypothetical protein